MRTDEGVNRLRFLVEHPQAWRITGPSDTAYVSDAQLGRHVLWRIESWDQRWPHRSKDLAIRVLNLVRKFSQTDDLTRITQAHRWEFLNRLSALPYRYDT